MAGIDKTYVTSYNDWKEIQNYMKNAKFTCPNGIVLHGRDYLYEDDMTKDEVEEWIQDYGEIPVMNTPTVVDYFLIKYCPIKVIQDRMHEVYNEDFINSVLNGTSKYDTFKRPVAGKIFKYIIKPKFYRTFNCWNKHYKRRLHTGYKINLIFPSDDYLYTGYNQDYDMIIYPNELGYITSSGLLFVNCKTIKALIRKLRKWGLPIGTHIEFFGMYKEEYGKLIITK